MIRRDVFAVKVGGQALPGDKTGDVIVFMSKNYDEAVNRFHVERQGRNRVQFIHPNHRAVAVYAAANGGL